MNITDIFIRRPVLATVVNLVVVLIGVIAYQRLPLREYPNIDEPVVTVSTDYTGASAEIIESRVTQPLEDALAGIEGIDVLTSVSRPEKSQITIRFILERDADAAASDVRDRVSRSRGKLPDDVEEPIISKVEADASGIIFMSFSSDRHSQLEVSDYLDRFAKDRLQTVPGVGAVQIYGERRYAMRIWLDRNRLAAYRLTPADVETALESQNIEVPAGRVESAEREFTVLTQTDLRTAEEFESIVLAERDGYLVRLKDVARVEIAAADKRRSARFNGRNAVNLGIVKQSDANPLDVSRAVRAVMPEISAAAPEGMLLEMGYDKTMFVERSLQAVFQTIGEAILLVVGVIFLFLRSLRATLIPLVTIPVSLVGACALMYLFGFSINTLTLLAFVLAIGLVVDDSIVMMENIFRHVEEGEPPVQAALVGAREITFAVIAMTLALAAVYAPIGFMTGRTGRLFTEFALTLAGSVLVSGFVAQTLTPMMCSKMLRHQPTHHPVYNFFERGFDFITRIYRRWLLTVLNFRWATIGGGLAVAGTSIFFFTALPSELAPLEDRSAILVVAIGPEGATMDYMDRSAIQIQNHIFSIPEVQRFFVITGFPVLSMGVSYIKLVDWEDRERSQMEITKELGQKLFTIPGVLAFPLNPPSLGQRYTNKPVQFVLQTSGRYDDLDNIVNQMMAEARKFPGMANIESDLKLNKPELKVHVNRDKAAAVGVEVDTIGRTLETLLGGRQVTKFKREGEQYDVIVQVEDEDRRNPADLSQIYVRGRNDVMIQLSNLVTVTEGVAPKELNRFNKMRAATLSATLLPGYSVGDALAHLREAGDRVLPDYVRVDYSGQTREFLRSRSGLYTTFLLALAFIYLVLSAQFESFRDPLIIMLTVPLSITGALMALYLSGGSMNVYSQIGLVTLVGLITKHGILIVEFSNQMQMRGMNIHDAVVEASVLRLRPILMTTGAMVLGAVPLAIAAGAGAESRHQIGWVIVGGLLLGTVLTLFVIPVAYSFMARNHQPKDDALAEALAAVEPAE